MPLEEYKAKRDFAKTPEPAGAAGDTGGDRFTIQQHDATRLHWDLRLERDGVLASWAIPRGLPWSPKENHLAVHTEDHPIEYLTFQGDIPEGEYGAGHMFVWDTGTYEADEWTDRKAVIVLKGRRANGRYALFQTRGRDWMIHRMDPPEDPDRRPLPDHIAPMQPEPGSLPERQKGWAFEIAWPGQRVLATSSGGIVALASADGDISRWFPEVRRMGRALGYTEVVLDGVLVDPSRGRDGIAARRKLNSDSAIRRNARDHPVALVAFDLLWLDGHPRWDEQWQVRRELLDDLRLDGPAWRASSVHHGDGRLVLDVAREQGLDGLIAKRTNAPYEPGKTSPAWRLVSTG